jgi:hypothetical protein
LGSLRADNGTTLQALQDLEQMHAGTEQQQAWVQQQLEEVQAR